ncbi:uncharacterized protein [Battus philenor]|uniref:uncharacterized protein n=1 Tax=Battus philenor TaxID=42288 RepID=UPI0035CF2FE4
MKIVLLFAVLLCAYAAENDMMKDEKGIMEEKSQDKRQTQEGAPETIYRSPRKQDQAAPVEEPQQENKQTGRIQLEQYRPGQVFSLNTQELLELQPERKAPLGSGQQLQQLYSNPQSEHKQNLQPFYYLDPQLAGQVSLQPSHAVIARPHYSSNGAEASVGAALSVSDTSSSSAQQFDQELLALLGQAVRQEEQRPQVFSQTQQPVQIAQQSIGQQYQQVERYVPKPSKKPTKLRPKVQVVPTQASTAPQQYLIETTNVLGQQQPLQNQYISIQPRRPAQTLRYIPIQAAQPAVQQPLYERPESQGLKIVPAPNLQNFQPQTQNNYVFVPQYQQEAPQKQYRLVDTQRQQIQSVRQEQPRIAVANVERPLTYLKRFPEPEKARTVQIYNQANLESLPSAPQPTQIIGEQYYLRPIYRSNEQKGRYEQSPIGLRLEQARAIESTKAPHSTIYVNKNIAPKKVLRPVLRIEPSQKQEQIAREQSVRVEKPGSSEQVSVEQHGKVLDEQRPQLPPPKNNKAYTPEEFAALVAAGYAVTPIPVGTLNHQVAQSRSSVETIQIPQRHPFYSRRHQYLPLRSDEAP